MSRTLISLIETDIKLYRSLEEYTDDLSSHAQQSEVRFENLSRAFVSFDIILLSVLTMFATAWLLPTLKRTLQIVQLEIRFIAIKTFKQIKIGFSRLKYTAAGVLAISMIRQARNLFVSKKFGSKTRHSLSN